MLMFNLGDIYSHLTVLHIISEAKLVYFFNLQEKLKKMLPIVDYLLSKRMICC